MKGTKVKQERSFPKAIIMKMGTRWVEDGHPWIYDAEVIRIEAEVGDGSLVDAVSESGKYLGTGYFSGKSRIRIRLLSTNANDTFGEPFYRRRIRYALDYRKAVMGEDVTCCRQIFGEADGFPGLTVDRFSNLLVSEVLSVGTERVSVPVLSNTTVSAAAMCSRNFPPLTVI